MYWVLQLDKQYQANYYRPRYADSRTSSDIDSLYVILQGHLIFGKTNHCRSEFNPTMRLAISTRTVTVFNSEVYYLSSEL